MGQVAGEHYSVGEIGPAGGIIFITPSTSGNTTGYYFEVCPKSHMVQRSWAQATPVNYQSTAVVGAEGTAVGTGYQNTLDIIAQGNTDPATSAAAYCRSITVKGYSDWFLPSKDELNHIYLNRLTAGRQNVDDVHWSSSEASDSGWTEYAWSQIFGNTGTQYSLYSFKLYASYYVNPVRMFSAPRTKFPEKSNVVKFGSHLPPHRLGNDSVYGTGLDGNVVIATDTTLTSDMYYQNLTVNPGVILKTNGFRVFVKETLTLNGLIGSGTSGGGEPVSSVPTGTVSGTSASTALVYSVGGQGGGATQSVATQLPASYRAIVDTFISGAVADVSGIVYPISGGSAGTPGTTGTTVPAYTNSNTWTGKAGTTNAGAAGTDGSYAPNAASVNAPGGKGNTGYTSTVVAGSATGATPGAGGAAGAGGLGGAVVLVIAKTINGSGEIISKGMSGTAGGIAVAGSPGTAGSAASGPGATAYSGITQRGTSGVNLVDGHQAPTMRHTLNPHHSTNPHHTTNPHHGTNPHHTHHAPAHHSHYNVFNNLHSHSNNVAPLASRTHHGHHHNAHDFGHGNNAHYYHLTNRHSLSHNSPAQYAAGHPATYAHHTDYGYAGNYRPGGNAYREPTFVLGYTNTSPRWSEPHTSSYHTVNGGHHTVNGGHHSVNGGHHNQDYAGGAGGAGGTAGVAGTAAPAVIGTNGGRGGVGGGGGIIVITENTPSGITYNSFPGQTAGSGSFSGSSGYTYIVLNK